MEEYIYKDGKQLRKGFTTGTCATATVKGALQILLTKKDVADVTLTLKSAVLTFPLLEKRVGNNWVSCAVKKDSGDDPDVTNGILVFAKVFLDYTKKGIYTIEGGLGVGRVTKPGLACAVGEAAINPVPKQMIQEQISQMCQSYGYTGGVSVTISIPEGVEIAKRTYNPRLGIVGGISILGTTGIVEPMSEQALVETIKIEMNMRKIAGDQYIILTPGNYGEMFLHEKMGVDLQHTVKCSNFIGDAIDYAIQCKFDGVLLVGHIGKFVKLAAGIMNTHSKYGDARMEILATHSILAGAPPTIVKELMDCITTDEAIHVLDEAEIRAETLQSMIKNIEFHLNERCYHQLDIGAILFSNKYGYLGETENVKHIIEIIQTKK